MDGQEPDLAQWLASHGAGGIPHPGGTLLAHLERVHARLAEWGARPALRRAGFCHAFYGTDGFAVALGDPARRDELAAIAGDEAERLVYLYASCDRGFSYPYLAQPAGPFRDRFADTVLRPQLSVRRDFAGAHRGQRAGYRDRQPRSSSPGRTGPAPPVQLLAAPAQPGRLAVCPDDTAVRLDCRPPAVRPRSAVRFRTGSCRQALERSR